MFERKFSEICFNVILRGVLGVLAIHFINLFAAKYGYAPLVGINISTIPVVSILGLPGLGILYVFALFW